jgi:hypothetical protein
MKIKTNEKIKIKYLYQKKNYSFEKNEMKKECE